MLARYRWREVADPTRRSRVHRTERREIERPIAGRQCTKVKWLALIYIAVNTRARRRSRQVEIVELLNLNAGLLAASTGRPLRVARKSTIVGNAARIANVDAIVRFSAQAFQQTGCMKRCERGTAAAAQHRGIGVRSDDGKRTNLGAVERQCALCVLEQDDAFLRALQGCRASRDVVA